MSSWLYVWLMLAAWRQQPGALIAAIGSIALGVALGLGIDLVNRSALNEFDNALAVVNGTAQYRLTSATGLIDDQWLERVEKLSLVQAASPVIDTEVLARTAATPADQAGNRLQIIAMDIFRAASVTPALLPQTGPGQTGGAASQLFADDSIFLSTAAAQRLQAGTTQTLIGKPLLININGRLKTLTIRGTVPGASGRAPLAVMDIGAAQWQLDSVGKLSRVDIRLTAGADEQDLRQALAKIHPEGFALRLTRPTDSANQMSNLSRAYRVNLNVLALVALLTGGFIVFASMELAILRLMPAMALVGVLGAPQSMQPRLVILIAGSLGMLGAAAGIGLGVGLAWLLLGLIGGDLGGGYFSTTRPPLVAPVSALALFAVLGVSAALCGGLSPALKLRRLALASALKSGRQTMLGNHVAPLRLSIGLGLAGLCLLWLPAIAGLPLGAYTAIACWLFAGVLLVGPVLGWVANQLSSDLITSGRPLTWLAIARLKSAHQSAFPALAGVVASFALVCAMGVMVHSFRVSVDQWLHTVLPADLYLRVPATALSGGLSPQEQAQLSAIPGVATTGFLRSLYLTLEADRPRLAVLARSIDNTNPARSLPLTGTWLSPDARVPGCTAVYASEPAATVYEWQVGSEISLPINQLARSTCFQVVAIWRDYARQHGAVALAKADYEALTGDFSVSDAALTLSGSASADQVVSQAREVLGDRPGLQIRSASDIRAVSLKIFDRSFAVTYALEAVALLVGLFGVATTYSGEALSREREFGMLRHLGLTRTSLARLFAAESFIAIGLGVLWGTGLGSLIAQVLIHWVNPQSFHWTMQTHWPVGLLGLSAFGLVALGVVCAIVAARRAAGQAPIAAVRADW